MLHSLELRSPFLDTALVEFAARLPHHLVRRGTTTKWILKRAFADLLPQAIAGRSKMGFTPPLGAWFRTDLRSYLEDHLAKGAKVFDIFRESEVRRYLREHQHGQADHGARLWLLLATEIWLRQLGSQVH
jgi:asparagine synthase (glutamine-hydrolysing)